MISFWKLRYSEDLLVFIYLKFDKRKKFECEKEMGFLGIYISA